MNLAVVAEGLTMRFGTFTAVDHVSFRVKRGEVFGFLGANGAGKTTTIRILCGLLLPTAGSAIVAGRNLREGLDRVKRVVGYMSQRFTLYNDLTVGENLAFTAALRRMSGHALARRTDELFALTGFTFGCDVLVRDLPPGVKQQVALVNAMLHDPEVVFLDEPTAGVTPASRAKFWGLIRRIASAGTTVFVTTHYMDEAEQCGRIALMRAGKIIALDTPAGLKATAFPTPMIELDPGPRSPRGWRRTFFGDASVGDLAPHGLRWHFAVRNAAAWARLARRLPKGLRARRIPASLEDVFMRLVEGKDR
jgi:ABC-2 type transport system ATP-binding protein